MTAEKPETGGSERQRGTALCGFQFTFSRSQALDLMPEITPTW